jgi:parallel beta-helix repeat protein
VSSIGIYLQSTSGINIKNNIIKNSNNASIYLMNAGSTHINCNQLSGSQYFELVTIGICGIVWATCNWWNTEFTPKGEVFQMVPFNIVLWFPWANKDFSNFPCKYTCAFENSVQKNKIKYDNNENNCDCN